MASRAVVTHQAQGTPALLQKGMPVKGAGWEQPDTPTPAELKPRNSHPDSGQPLLFFPLQPDQTVGAMASGKGRPFPGAFLRHPQPPLLPDHMTVATIRMCPLISITLCSDVTSNLSSDHCQDVLLPIVDEGF